MFQVVSNAWALLLGMMLLMIGNGLQGTLLGVRGAIEGFSTLSISVVMSAYFMGFLVGSRLAPGMIRRVGHVRVFAALASLISAALILFPAITDPWVWVGLRMLLGLCFAGVYVTAESWLNHAASNDTRGKALALYMIVQMVGLVVAQGILTLGDPSGYVLFIIPSVLVSISFAPILLSIAPTPAFDTAKRMSMRALYSISPLSCVGTFLLGGVYSAAMGMAAVFGTQAGLSVAQISTFVAMIFVGGLVLQYPIGWLSDRMDRRQLITGMAALATLGALAGLQGSFSALLLSAFVIGAAVNPLYALLLAYTNDFLEVDDMAAASGTLNFLNGVGAVAGPLVTGWLMTRIGPSGFFVFLALLMAALVAYGVYRMTQRPSPDETGHYAPVLASTSPVAVELAQEVFIEAQEEATVEQIETNGN